MKICIFLSFLTWPRLVSLRINWNSFAKRPKSHNFHHRSCEKVTNLVNLAELTTLCRIIKISITNRKIGFRSLDNASISLRSKGNWFICLKHLVSCTNVFCDYIFISSSWNGLNRGDKGLVVVLKSIGSATGDKAQIKTWKGLFGGLW